MKNYLLVLLVVTLSAYGHPGSGIVADERGNVYITVTGEWAAGLWRIDTQSRATRLGTNGAHWLGLDARGNFTRSDLDGWFRQRITPWLKRTPLPGSDAVLIQADGSPLAMNPDGSLSYVKGLEVARLTRDGKVTLIVPGIKDTVDKLGGIKGLAYGPEGTLYAACPSAVLTIKTNGTFATLVHPITLSDCDANLPPNTAADLSPYLTGLTVDSRGVIWTAATGCRRLIRISNDGRVSVALKAESPWAPTGVALHGENTYVLEFTNANDDTHEWQPRVRKLTRDGKVTTLLTIPRDSR